LQVIGSPSTSAANAMVDTGRWSSRATMAGADAAYTFGLIQVGSTAYDRHRRRKRIGQQQVGSSSLRTSRNCAMTNRHAVPDA
jgi:hypothetical protein